MAVNSPLINRGVIGFWIDTLPGSTQMVVVDSSGNCTTQAIPTSDHGTLTGLADNDHPQYALLVGATFSGPVTATKLVGQANSGNLIEAYRISAAQNVFTVNELGRVNCGAMTVAAKLGDTASHLAVNTNSLIVTNAGNVSTSGTFTLTSATATIAFATGNTIVREQNDGSMTLSCQNFAGAGWIISNTSGNSATVPLAVKGKSDQTAALQQWQLSTGSVVASVSPAGTITTLGDYVISELSSTSTQREQLSLVGSWVTSTDATRKAQCEEKVYDTAARTVARSFADGTNGYKAFKVLTTAPADADLAVSEVVFYTNGSGHLAIKLKDSGGTVRTGTVSLT